MIVGIFEHIKAWRSLSRLARREPRDGSDRDHVEAVWSLVGTGCQ